MIKSLLLLVLPFLTYAQVTTKVFTDNYDDSGSNCGTSGWNHTDGLTGRVSTSGIGCLHGPFTPTITRLSRKFQTSESHSNITISFRYWLLCQVFPAYEGKFFFNGVEVTNRALQRGGLQDPNACTPKMTLASYSAGNWMGSASTCLGSFQLTACYTDFTITMPHSSTEPFNLKWTAGLEEVDGFVSEWGVSHINITAIGTFRPTVSPTKNPTLSPTMPSQAPSLTPTAQTSAPSESPTVASLDLIPFSLYIKSNFLEANDFFTDEYLTSFLTSNIIAGIAQEIIAYGDSTVIHPGMEIITKDFEEYEDDNTIFFDMVVSVPNDAALGYEVKEVFDQQFELNEIQYYLRNVTEEYIINTWNESVILSRISEDDDFNENKDTLDIELLYVKFLINDKTFVKGTSSKSSSNNENNSDGSDLWFYLFLSFVTIVGIILLICCSWVTYTAYESGFFQNRSAPRRNLGRSLLLNDNNKKNNKVEMQSLDPGGSPRNTNDNPHTFETQETDNELLGNSNNNNNKNNDDGMDDLPPEPEEDGDQLPKQPQVGMTLGNGDDNQVGLGVGVGVDNVGIGPFSQQNKNNNDNNKEDEDPDDPEGIYQWTAPQGTDTPGDMPGMVIAPNIYQQQNEFQE